MSNIVYPLLLFIFIFGASGTFINESGLYSHKLPVSETGFNTSQAGNVNTVLTEAASSNDQGTFGVTSLVLMGKVIIGGITAIFTLGPLLTSYHVPGAMVAWIISPLGIVLVFWIIEMWLGRSQE
jgi:hypothetical protein